MLYWTHSTVYIDCSAWSMERNQNKVHILLYRAAHGVLHQEAQVWSMASCAKHSTWSWTEMKWSPDFVWVQVHGPTHERDQVWSTASYCVQCAHAAWPWRQIKWEWKKILSCQVESNNFQGSSREFFFYLCRSQLISNRKEDYACVVHWIPLCASRVPSQTNVYSIWLSAEWYLERSRCFLLCVEWSCSLTHEDRPRSSLNGERLLLTWKIFQDSNRESSSVYNNLWAGSREPSIYIGPNLEATERSCVAHGIQLWSQLRNNKQVVICYRLEPGK